MADYIIRCKVARVPLVNKDNKPILFSFRLQHILHVGNDKLTCMTTIFFILFTLQVFKGYVDDPRNTDVAWVETMAMNYHDDSGEIFNKIKLQVYIIFFV